MMRRRDPIHAVSLTLLATGIQKHHQNHQSKWTKPDRAFQHSHTVASDCVLLIPYCQYTTMGSSEALQDESQKDREETIARLKLNAAPDPNIPRLYYFDAR